MALSSTGTAVADGVYTTLYDASRGGAEEGQFSYWWTIKVTAGTATIKVQGTIYGATARTIASTDDPWEIVTIGGKSPITKIEAAGSGGAATVAFWSNS